jgi:hypothetical protein
MHPAKIIIALSILGSSAVAMGQINGSNLLEYQYGKIPGDSSAFSSVYDRAVVKYSQKKFTGAVTLEQYQSPFESRNYHKLTQYSLQYTSEPLEVKIGNFYETIGRGLLLRSFEIPGAVLEDISYRSRHYFNRDVLGFNVKYRVKNLSFKFLFGRPLSYVFPPGIPIPWSLTVIDNEPFCSAEATSIDLSSSENFIAFEIRLSRICFRIFLSSTNTSSPSCS